MPLLLIEDLVTKLRDYLSANFDAKLEQLENSYPDEITLPRLQAIVLDELALEEVQLYPIIYILGSQTFVERYNSEHTDAVHTVDVGVVHLQETSEASVLRVRMYRYMRALWECLLNRNISTDYQDFFTVGQPIFDFMPILARDAAGPYLMDAHITVRFNKQEYYDG